MKLSLSVVLWITKIRLEQFINRTLENHSLLQSFAKWFVHIVTIISFSLTLALLHNCEEEIRRKQGLKTAFWRQAQLEYHLNFDLLTFLNTRVKRTICLKQVYTQAYHGMILKYHMSWKPHVEHVTSKSSPPPKSNPIVWNEVETPTVGRDKILYKFIRLVIAYGSVILILSLELVQSSNVVQSIHSAITWNGLGNLKRQKEKG